MKENRWSWTLRLTPYCVAALFLITLTKKPLFCFCFYKSMKSWRQLNITIRLILFPFLSCGKQYPWEKLCTEDHVTSWGYLLCFEQKNLQFFFLRAYEDLFFFSLVVDVAFIYLLHHNVAWLFVFSVLRLIFNQSIYVMLGATIRIRHFKHIRNAE